RNAGQALRSAFLEAVGQGAVRQLHDDDEVVVDVLETVQEEDEGVAHRLDADERFPFLIGARAVRLAAAEDGVIVRRGAALHELDGFEKPAGRLGFPDFAEAAAAEALDEPIAWDRFSMRFDAKRHAWFLYGKTPRAGSARE